MSPSTQTIVIRIGRALVWIVYAWVAITIVLLFLGFLLQLFGADPSAGFVEFVYRSTPASKYATFFYAQFDQQRRELRYVNAGHNAPYLLRAGRGSTGDAVPPEIEQLSV